MSIMIFFLWILLGAAILEIIYGIIKRSAFLITVGLVVAVMCALGLYLGVCRVDSIYITGEGRLV